jgi:phosphatidylserine/phosphatidylglycerophosphate/cardiolipin synthase-like enzyme
MAIDDRISKFFVAAADLEIPGEQVPITSAENQVTHLIDGSSYFGALRSEVTALKGPGTGNRFFYFTDWVLMLVAFDATPAVGGLPSSWDEHVQTSAFRLDNSSGAVFPPFLDELAAMSANGVDVRALAWVSPLVLTVKIAAEKEHRYNNYAASLLSVKALREKPGMARKACLNLLAHPLGAMHLKTVVCGDDTNASAYVSGIDFQSGRVDERTHPHGSPAGGYGWHDVGARVEGPGADTVYSYFRRLWDEQIARDPERFRFGDDEIASHDDQFEPVPDRSFLPVAGATHHVQVLRTAPQMHLAFGSTTAVPVNCVFRAIVGFSRPTLPFAPDGIFEFRAALRKAIAAAETYIYVEDQAFTGREIMKWVHDRLIAKPDLKVIFVYGGDPTDPPEVRMLLNMAVNEHLAPGVPNIANRVAFYFRTDNVVVHSKTWIIDDEFAIIGSANAMRRSLYTDGEVSVGVLDENEGPGSFAVAYRSDLWAEHCGVYDAAGRARFEDLDLAIRIWDPTWSATGGSGAAPGTLRSLERKRVPFTQGSAADEFPNPVLLPTTPEQRAELDRNYDVSDGDSRQEY